MRAILTIASKDLRAVLWSPIFMLITGLCTVIWSNSYIRVFYRFAEDSMNAGPSGEMSLQRYVFNAHISLVNLLLIFVVPALTMRLLAEEKKQRSFDLLLTAPVTSTQIVLGKFIAGLGIVSVLLGVSLLYPLITRAAADYSMSLLLLSYFGLFLVAAMYVSVGLFASSLTESVMLSVVMGLSFNILIWFIGQGADSSEGFAKILDHVATVQHFFNFLIGSVKLTSLVYFASVVGLFVFLTQRVVESSRWR